MMDQECHFCSGKLSRRCVTRLQQLGDHWVIIENVPALVCEQCGERYYTPEVHDQVLALVSGGKRPTREDRVPVYDAACVPA
jgi:YgiT-type zinc finger domain-containing protein